MQNRLPQFHRACDQYVERLKKSPEVIGIIVSGSFVHSTLDPNSDIDIYAVLDPDCEYRERGNTWIEGVEIEYFLNPPQQIRAYFRQEKSPHTAHILVNGIVVYSESPIVEALIGEAKEVWETPPPAMQTYQLELAKYFTDDLGKDWEDCIYNKDQFAGELIKFQWLNHGLELFCMVHRIYRTKHKRLLGQITEIDAEFGHLVNSLIKEDWDKPLSLPRLQQKIEELLGGKRNREWVFRGDLELS